MSTLYDSILTFTKKKKEQLLNVMNYENPSLAKEVNLKMIRSLIVFADM